jgi:hypothetical protein
MKTMSRVKSVGLSALAVVGMSAALLSGVPTASQGATATPGEGIECTPGTSSFNLSTATGRISMPDGNTVFSWGYSTPSHGFQLPGPVICVTQGTTVTVTLNNTLSEPTSLVFPGQHDVTADGQPSAPLADSTGRVTSLAPVAAANGGTVTYSFVADKPGTFLYESGTDVNKQVEMGLYGALIVRPTASATQAYGDAGSAFEPTREYLHLLSQVDPELHLAVEQNKPFDWSKYSPKYFLLNGRSAPDTISPNDAPWLPSQPYGAMVRVRVQGAGGDNLPALVRYINVMNQDAAFHPHGNTERVIAQDGQPFTAQNGDRSYGSFLVDIGANRTVDAMFTFSDTEHYDPVTNPIPVAMNPAQDVLISASTWYSLNPYLGKVSSLPAGVTNMNQCGEYYHMAHNHNLSKATNYGLSFGGQMTFIRIDPPNGCPAQ